MENLYSLLVKQTAPFNSLNNNKLCNKSNIDASVVKNTLLGKLCLIFALFVLPFSLSAADRYAVNSGNWNVTSTWSTSEGGSSGASIPTASDIVYINASKSVTVPSNYIATCSQLYLGARNTNSPKLIFAASTSRLNILNDLISYAPTGGSTRDLNVNAGTLTISGSLYLNQNTSGSSNKWETNMVITSGTVNVAGDLDIDNVAGADYRQCEIYMSGGAGTFNLGGNMILGNGIGTLYGGTSSTFNYNGANPQTVQLSYSRITYNNLHTNSALATISAAITTTNVKGHVRVQSGILSNGGFTMVGNSLKTLEVANGAELRLGGTTAMPTGFGTKVLGTTSTVHYNGNNQTVGAEAYGHLTLSGTSGAVVKTLPSGTLTVAGNLTSLKGTATTVSYTAAGIMNIGGNVSIESSTTFTAATFSHTFSGNMTNSGTFTGSTSTVTFNGAAKNISGSGVYNFNNLTVSAAGVTANANQITVAGNFLNTSTGTFNQTAGTLTMSGASKTILGPAINFFNLTIANTITSTTDIDVAGNVVVNSGNSFIMSAGSITMTGTGKTITNNNILTISKLYIPGSVTTTTNFNITSVLDVTDGTFAATAGTAAITGATVLTGEAYLFNVTLNASLQLNTDAVLGIAGVYTISGGSLNVTTTIPNTVVYRSSGARSIPAGTYHNLVFASGTNTATGIFAVSGDISISSGSSLAAGAFNHSIRGNFTNNGSFTAGTSTITFSGGNDVAISGTTTFNNVTLTKGTATVTLQSDISVGTLTMTNGDINTLTNTLTITTTRSGNGIILGNIQRTHAFSSAVAYQFEGPYNTITFTAPMGVTSVLVKVTVGAVGDFPNGSSINRLYEIVIPNGTYSAALRLHYEDAELNGNAEANLNMYRFNSVWLNSSRTSNDVTNNYVELTAQSAIAGRWTLSDAVDKIARWNGSVSNVWTNAANWSSVSGAPALPPTSAEIVQIGTAAYTNAPVITTAVTVKSISFGSAMASTLTLNAGGTLTVSGNIGGVWAANSTHTINSNGQNMTVNGSVTLSDGTAGNAINLNIGTGTVTIAGNLTQSGGANIVFSGAGNLTMSGNYTYSSGTVTPSTGTITYSGSLAQSIAAVNYNNLIINKTTNPATMNTATTVGGNMTISGGTLVLNAAPTVNGNVSIATGTTLTSNGVTINVKGNWTNSGTFTSSGTVAFNGTGAQTIGASNFNNLTISKSAGTASLTGNVSIVGNLSLSAGSFDLGTFTANRTAAGGTLTFSAGSTMLLAGASNYPANFSATSVSITSTVHYNGIIAQTIASKTYANLTLSNGAANNKTPAASFTANGNVTINNGATLNGGAFTISIGGNWTNNGTFTPVTSTLNFNGTAKTITGVSTFFNSNFFGSYTIANTDLTSTGQMGIKSGSSLNMGTGLMIISKDLINNGSLVSAGTVTFTGTAAQIIQYSSALQTDLNIVNFNGTVAPTMTSTSSPTIAILNVNNTAGVTTSVDWTVTTACTIASGASFNGGIGNHVFGGSFVNNGTITSSGNITFAPASAQTIQLKGTNFTSTGTVIFGGTAAMTVSGTPNTITNVIINNSVGVTPTVGWTVAGTFTINTDKIFNASTFSYTVAGDFQGDGILNPGTSTFTLTGSGKELYGNEDLTFYDLIITGSIIATADYNVARNFTNNGTYDGSEAALTMSGGTASVITGAAASFALGRLVINKNVGITATLAKNITTVTVLQVLSGTFDPATFTVTEDAVNTGTLLIEDNGTYKVNATNTLPVFTTYDFSDLSTVNYAGTNQTVSSSAAYGKLLLSGSGTKTAIAAVTVNNTLTVNAGIIFDMATFAFSGTMSSNTGTGTIKTRNLSASPLPANASWASTVDYSNATGSQYVVAGTYTNLTLSNTSGTNTGVGNFAVNGTLTLNAAAVLDMATFALTGTLSSVSGTGSIRTQNTTATPLPAGKTWPGTVIYNNATGAQTIISGTYANLTNSNTSGTNTTNAVLSVSNTLTLSALSMLDLGTFALSGSIPTITGSGSLKTQNTSATPIPTGRTWAGTIEYNNATGGQTIVAGTYTNLTNSNTSGINTCSSALSVSGTLTLNSGSVMDLVSYALSGSIGSIAGIGTLKTQNTSATPIPSGKSWTCAIEFNNAAGGQTIVAGTYANLSNSNTSGTNTAAGAITVNDGLVLSSASVLDMATHALTGALTSVTGTGTLRTQNTTATPIPSGKTWAGTIQYNRTAGGQTVVAGTYNNLSNSNTSGNNTAAGTVTVNATLTLTAGGTLDMSTQLLAGTLSSITGTGVLRSQNTSATPIPAGKTWTGDVNFNSSSAQTIPNGNYTNLLATGGNRTLASSGTIGISNTFTPGAGTYTVTGSTVNFNGANQTIPVFGFNNLSATGSSTTKMAAGNLIVNGILTINSGATVDLVTYTIGGTLASAAGTGILKTQNISTTPLPEGKSWAVQVFYNSILAQSIVSGNYTDLNASGGNRILSTDTIGIAGTFTPGTGVYNTTDSWVNFNGSGAQNVPAFMFNNLTVSGGNTKSVAGSVAVKNLLFLGDNTTLSLGNNFITLKSDSANTASIGAVPTTATITYGTGGFTVERYAIGRRKYRMITSSVTTSTNAVLTVGEESKSIWGTWQNSGINTTPNVGTFITGGTAANGFDTQLGSASMYTYNPVTRAFVAHSTANGKNTKYTPLIAGRPYYLFVYGDRRNSLTTSNPNNTTLIATGQILTGNQRFDSTGPVPISTVIGQYSFMGNPFASTVDWKKVSKTGVSKTIWGWDPNLNATGGYVTVTDVLGGILIAPMSGAVKISQEIQPGQAFFVKTTGSNPVVTIKESDKINITTNGLFRTTPPPMPLIAVNMLYTSGSVTYLGDGAVVTFDPSFDNAVTDDDAVKYAGSNEVVSITNSGTLLNMETRKYPVSSDTIMLNMQKITKPLYTLEIFGKDLPAGVYNATLIDTYLNTQRLLSLTDTNRIPVSISTSIPASYKADRFMIIFGRIGVLPVTFTSVKASRQQENIKVEWTVANQVNLSSYNVQRSADGQHFTTVGVVAANAQQTGYYSFIDLKPVSGDNFYRIESVDIDGKLGYSVIVKIKAEAGQEKISIYPNPVTGRVVNVKLENMVAGIYNIRIISSAGDIQANTDVKHTGGTQVHGIDLPNLRSGSYYVELTKADNSTLLFRIVKL